MNINFRELKQTFEIYRVFHTKKKDSTKLKNMKSNKLNKTSRT